MAREAEIAQWIMDGHGDNLEDGPLATALTQAFPGITLRELHIANQIADELFTSDEVERRKESRDDRYSAQGA